MHSKQLDGPGRIIQKSRSLTLILAAVLILCVFSSLYVASGADFSDYSDFFVAAQADKWSVASSFRFEPIFIAISILVSSLESSPLIIFTSLTFLALTVKLFSISSFCIKPSTVFIVALIYIVRFFPLHDLTQIRLGMAIAFVFLAFTRHSLAPRLIFSVASVFSHYSTIIMVPFIIIAHFSLNIPTIYSKYERSVWITTIFSLILTAFLYKAIVDSLGDAFVAVAMYANGSFGETAVNLFSIAIILDVIVLSSALLLSPSSPELRFYLLLQIVGLGLFVILKDLPVLAHRMRELFSVFWIFYFGRALESPRAWRRVAIYGSVGNLAIYAYLNFIGANALFHF